MYFHPRNYIRTFSSYNDPIEFSTGRGLMKRDFLVTFVLSLIQKADKKSGLGYWGYVLLAFKRLLKTFKYSFKRLLKSLLKRPFKYLKSYFLSTILRIVLSGASHRVLHTLGSSYHHIPKESEFL